MSQVQREGGVSLLEKEELKRPSKWKVLLHNDDVTTMEFVVSILTSVFNKSEEEATKIMLQVHYEGVGVAGVYSKDIAETKAQEARLMARDQKFPLRLSVVEE